MAKKQVVWAAAVLGLAVASGGAWWLQRHGVPGAGRTLETSTPAGAAASAGASTPGAPGAPRAPGVEVTQVTVARLQDDAQAVGSLKSRQSVMLRPEVAGRISQIAFSDGAPVRKGQLLVQLDDVLQKAELSQAQAQVSIARANLVRNQELVAQNFVARRVLDESQASLQVAEAQLALAQARLARMRIVAPFDGTLGIRNINLGDYVKDGADLVNLEDTSALYVDFRLPERYQAKLASGQTVKVELDAMPGVAHEARVVALDPLLDANGRSVAVRALLPSASRSPLRPGMFARVTTVFAVNEQALTVPEEAIVPQGGRQFVFVLEPKGDTGARVSRKVEVKLGARRDATVQVLDGLKVGDTVVVAGQQRLQKDGTEVRVVDMASRKGDIRSPQGASKNTEKGAESSDTESTRGQKVLKSEGLPSTATGPAKP